MPYISASIIMQLMSHTVPSLKQLRKEGEAGRRKITQYTRYGTVVLATFQAIGISIALQGQSRRCRTCHERAGPSFIVHRSGDHAGDRHHVPDVAGRAGYRAGCRQRHLHDHLRRASWPVCRQAIGGTLELVRTGRDECMSAFVPVAMALAVTAFVVFVERGQRRITVNYAKRQQGRKMYAAQSSHLPLKLNMAGVIPPIFASSIILFPPPWGAGSVGTENMGWLQDTDVAACRPGSRCM
jgi:preprotein translocase subunit SecY